MASQYPPKKNTAFTLYFTLYKNDGTVIANPGTITKKYSIDGAAVANLSNSVTEEDTTYGQCSIVLTAGEMNGDAIWLYIKDDTTGCVPFTATIYTVAQTLDEMDTVNDGIKAKTDNLPSSPAAVGSAMTLADDAIKAASYDESTAFPLKSADTGATAVARTGADSDTLETLSDQLDAVKTDTAAILTDTGTDGVVVAVASKTGYALSAAGISSIWSALTSGMSTAGSIGKLLVDNINATISSRSTYAGGDTAGTTTLLSRISSALTITSGNVDVNDKTGFSLSSSGVSAIWAALTSGLTTAGSIGKLLVDNINATISSRSTYAGADTPGTTTLLSRIASALTITGGNVDVNDKTGFSLSTAGISSIWNALTSGMSTVGSIGKRIVDYLTGDSFSRLGAPTGASVSSDIAAVKAKTDNLPASPAAVGSAMTLATSAVTAESLTPAATSEIADAVWDELTSGHLTAGTTGYALANCNALGTGTIAWPFTVTKPDLITPIDNVLVWVSLDISGSNRIGSGYTDSLGQVTFYFDAPATYYFWCAKMGFDFNNPIIQAVS